MCRHEGLTPAVSARSSSPLWACSLIATFAARFASMASLEKLLCCFLPGAVSSSVVGVQLHSITRLAIVNDVHCGVDDVGLCDVYYKWKHLCDQVECEFYVLLFLLFFMSKWVMKCSII